MHNRLGKRQVIIVMVKRPVIQLENMQNAKKRPSPDKFPVIPARAGQEKYGDVHNFKIGYTTSKGYHIIVGSQGHSKLFSSWITSRLAMTIYGKMKRTAILLVDRALKVRVLEQVRWVWPAS